MFKKGDRLVAVEDTDRLRKGDICVAVSEERSGISRQLIEVRLDKDGYEGSWYTRRFKLAEKQEKPMTEDTYSLTVASPEFIDYRRIYKETIADGVRVARVKTTGKRGSILMVEKKILNQGEYRVGGIGKIMRLLDLGVYYGGKGQPVQHVYLTDKEWGEAYGLIKDLIVSPLIASYKKETTVTVEPIKMGAI